MYIGIKTFLEIFGNKLCKSLKSFLNKPEMENVLFPVTFLTWFQFNQGNLKYIEKKIFFFKKAKLKHDCSKYELQYSNDKTSSMFFFYFEYCENRRHSDSETQSVSSHTYSLNGDSRESLLSHRSRSIQVYQGVLTHE